MLIHLFPATKGHLCHGWVLFFCEVCSPSASGASSGGSWGENGNCGGKMGFLYFAFPFALVLQTRWKRWPVMHRIIQVSLHINSWPFLVSDTDMWSRKADWFVWTAEPTLNQSYKAMLWDWEGNSCSSSSEWHLKCKFSVWVLLFVWSNTLIPFKNGAAFCMCRWGIRVRMLKLWVWRSTLASPKIIFGDALNSRKCYLM